MTDENAQAHEDDEYSRLRLKLLNVAREYVIAYHLRKEAEEDLQAARKLEVSALQDAVSAFVTVRPHHRIKMTEYEELHPSNTREIENFVDTRISRAHSEEEYAYFVDAETKALDALMDAQKALMAAAE